MKKLLAGGLLVAGMFLLTWAHGADEKSEDPARAALQELNEFVGSWKGAGGPDKAKFDAKEGWSEKIAWGWRFKKSDPCLVMEIKDGKHLKSGELRYLPDKKVYQLTTLDKKDEKKVFEGQYKKGYLEMDRVDPKTKETQRITMNSAGDGIRFIYRYSTKAEGSTIFVREYKVESSKEGESLGKADKKNECVLTGGLGTIAVSHKGQTYYVCCTGCRDEFNDNPDKVIKEYLARKGKK